MLRCIGIGLLAAVLGACGGASRGAHAPVAQPVLIPVHGVGGEIETVTPAATSAKLVVSFRNDTGRPVRVVRYRVTWMAGSAEVTPADLRVGAGATTLSELCIGPEAGDLYALYQAPMGARVVVLAIADAE
jgi:hypothetical protein